MSAELRKKTEQIMKQVYNCGCSTVLYYGVVVELVAVGLWGLVYLCGVVCLWVCGVAVSL